MGHQRRGPSSVQPAQVAPGRPCGRGLQRRLGSCWGSLTGSGLLCALLCTAPVTGLACEPAEQAAAERRARELSRQLTRNASVEARRILREAKRELVHLESEAQKLEKKARRGVKRARRGVEKLQERGEEARELLEKFQPPPESSAPVHPDTAITCDGDTCTIDQETAARYAKEPMMLLHEGTILPLPSVGEETGLKILSLRPGGLGERLGLRPGDVLRDVDGAPLTALFRDPETQRRLARQRSWTLHLTRDGRSVHKSIALR